MALKNNCVQNESNVIACKAPWDTKAPQYHAMQIPRFRQFDIEVLVRVLMQKSHPSQVILSACPTFNQEFIHRDPVWHSRKEPS
jgi:hypothetical protein